MAKRVTKEDLIKEVVKDTGLTNTQVRMVWDSLFVNVAMYISQGKRVVLNGLGTFMTQKRAPRTGRNPHTGEPVKIPARTIPRFIPDEDMKAAAYMREGKK